MLNLYAYGRDNPLAFTDPTGRDIISGTGNQAAIKAALVAIASHPGGREFLTKLDNLSVKIAVSTGRHLTDKQGNLVYGKTGPQVGSDGKVTKLSDSSGKIVDVKGSNLETTVDFGLAKTDRKDGVAGAPTSDAELLGHELKHDEAALFDLPNTEKDVDTGIDDILNTTVDKDLQKDAGAFVDDLLKPKDQGSQQPAPEKTQPPPGDPK